MFIVSKTLTDPRFHPEQSKSTDALAQGLETVGSTGSTAIICG